VNIGEFVDHFATDCGVKVTVATNAIVSTAGADRKTLKKCLGDANGVDTSDDNVEVYNWDYGTGYNPHAIKVVHDDFVEIGFVSGAVDGANAAPAEFVSISKFVSDATFARVFATDGVATFVTEYDATFNAAIAVADGVSTLTVSGTITGTLFVGMIITTTGADIAVANVVKITSFGTGTGGAGTYIVSQTASTKAQFTTAEAAKGSLDKLSGVAIGGSKKFTTLLDTSCETNAGVLSKCLSKGDSIFVFSATSTVQMYTVVRLSTVISSNGANTKTFEVEVDYPLTAADAAPLYIVHFEPSDEGSYEYISQCSNRGTCDTASGLCQCFKGYTGDDCSVQSALAV